MRISDWSSDVCSSDLSGVCQDLAHVFIAAARSQGMAARYISGHLLRQDGAELKEAAHAWAEAHVPGLGGVAFDPANGICGDEPSVCVAGGLALRYDSTIGGARFWGGGETTVVGPGVRSGQAQVRQNVAWGRVWQYGAEPG